MYRNCIDKLYFCLQFHGITNDGPSVKMLFKSVTIMQLYYEKSHSGDAGFEPTTSYYWHTSSSTKIASFLDQQNLITDVGGFYSQRFVPKEMSVKEF